jgi:hypothetical protein
MNASRAECRRRTAVFVGGIGDGLDDQARVAGGDADSTNAAHDEVARRCGRDLAPSEQLVHYTPVHSPKVI